MTIQPMNEFPCPKCGKPGWVEVKRNGKKYYLCKECYLEEKSEYKK